MTADEDDEIGLATVFDDADSAERAFIGAGLTALEIRRSGEQAVAEAVRAALAPFTDEDGRIELPAWCRMVLARP